MPDHREILEATPLARHLPEGLRGVVLASFEAASFAAGAPIVSEGEEADAYYVIASGEARVVRGQGAAEVELGRLQAGDGFGEMGLLERGPRSASVRATRAVEALRLHRAVFSALCDRDPAARAALERVARQRAIENLFHLYPAFADLPEDALPVLLDALTERRLAAGEVALREGDPAGPLYVVQQGKLRATVAREGARRDLAFLRVGDLFGEISALTGQPRAATVTAVTEARLLALSPEVVAALGERWPAFRRRLEHRIAQYRFRAVARVPLDFAAELLPADARAEPGAAVEEVEEAPSPEAPRGPRRARRAPWVRQADEMDCGPACLAIVCRVFGRRVALSHVRRLAGTGTQGTTLRGLLRAGESLGLAGRAVKVGADALDGLPLPAILHWDGNHWVVLVALTGRAATISDPGSGVRRLSRAQLAERFTGYAALFDYTSALELTPEQRLGLSWALPFVAPHTRDLLHAALLAVAATAAEMVVPLLTQTVFDRVLVDRDLDLLHTLMLALGAVLAFSITASMAQRYLLAFVAVRMDASTLDFISRRLLSLPSRYFSARKTGDIQRRLGGLRQIREFVVQQGVGVLTATAQLGGAVALMLLYNPRLTAVFLVVASLYLVLMRWSRARLRPAFMELEETFGRYYSHQIDAIKGIETVKAIAAEASFRELLLERFLGLAQTQFRADFTLMTYHAGVRVVNFMVNAATLYVGARQVLDGALTLGGLVAIAALVNLALAPLGTLLGAWDSLQLMSVLIARLDDVLSEAPEQGADRSALAPVPALSGAIRVQGLVFQYGGAESPRILDGVTVDIPAGRRVAVVGRSGCGKTTLVRCLVGLLEPTSGSVAYDGVDMRQLDWRQLRRHIGFVLQDNYLFDDTIAANISGGERSPEPARLREAARIASADEFIERLPLGYRTRVGESGLSLSGGQRQRLAIARAVYPDPPVLLFDEATSALDSESERAVKDNLDRLLAGRTSIVIAHRLSTIRDADLILVLEKGRLAEQGTHDELMDKRGLYFYLVSQQVEG